MREMRHNTSERILLADIGNTCVKIGLADASGLGETWSLPTRIPHTSDSLGLALTGLLGRSGLGEGDVAACAVCSVVPDLTPMLRDAVARYLACPTLNFPEDFAPGLENRYDNPSQVGADRLLAAFAARRLFPEPASLISVDFGTATTYDLITEKGEFAAGITAPGMRISSEALWTQAAKLPKIEIRKPRSILAQETISSMQAGLVYGQIGQTEYIIKKVKEESGLKQLKVVATGGLGRLIAEETEAIDIYDSYLTLEGLRIIYEKNRKS